MSRTAIDRLSLLAVVATFVASCASPAVVPSGSNGAATFGSTPSPAQPTSSSAAFATGSPTAGPSSPSPTVPAGLIAFDRFEGSRGVEGQHLATYVVHPDGTDERRLPVPAKYDGTNAVWSPDGRKLLLTLWTLPDGPARPGAIGPDGTGFALIKPDGLKGDLGCSAWSPDGRTLLCSMGSGAHPEVDGIYTIRVDGSHLTRLTTSPFHDTVGASGECGGGDSRGTYSPDGATIVFIRQKCGTGPDPSSDESAGIESMNADGSGLLEIVPQGRVRSHPGSQVSWSPDGTQLALGSQDGRLFLVHPDGTGLTEMPLPADLAQYAAYGPTWSPDGSRIAFTMYRGSTDSTDLYTVSTDGSNLTQVTNEPGVEGYANWGRAANP